MKTENLAAEALLGRPELPIDLNAAHHELAGRRILVTGAGGSVGTALAALLLSLGPAELVLLDHHDHALFSLQRRLEAVAAGGSWRLALADVRDDTALARLLDDARPEVVFHLAAYKHVSLGEKFPTETFKVNVLATARLLELAAERGVERLVYPSSDKAVNPPSLYGATKRISEVLVQRAARRKGARYLVSRYVNIVGTRGSVIETFAEQIAAGQPLTVTDPSMARYWITMPEATWLIVQAAAVGAPESVLMLDACEELLTVEVARRLKAVLAPATGEPAYRFTGARPGERLHEVLLSANESFSPGPCPGILEISHASRAEQLTALPELLADLTALVDRADPTQFKSAVMEAAQALQ